MSSYFVLQTGMCRGENIMANKKACSWKREYFYLEADMLASISEYEDGLIYRSAAGRFTVPAGAQPSTAEVYESALARWQVSEDKRLAELAKEKALKELLKTGKLYAADEPEVVAHFLDDFTVFDTETTGLSPEKDRILELAAVRYKNWQEVERLQLFLRFTGQVPYFITNLTGITSSDVRYASEAKVVLSKFRKLAGDSLLVGHNLSFDIRMIEAERSRLGAVAPLPNPTFCTMELAKRRTQAPHKLGKLCERFDIPVVGAHRALNDVLMTYELLRYLHVQQPISQDELSTKRIPVRQKQAAQPTLFAA